VQQFAVKSPINSDNLPTINFPVIMALSRILKKEHAKLQWKFLTAEQSEDRVLYFECRYRAICQDEVLTIVQTDDNTLFDIGYRPVHVRVDEQPNDSSEIINILHHLQNLTSYRCVIAVDRICSTVSA
jgi:hypothetical protein